ncbi:hypothetical protein DSUL_50456 [Desulfovibrionales bacterium]
MVTMAKSTASVSLSIANPNHATNGFMFRPAIYHRNPVKYFIS